MLQGVFLACAVLACLSDGFRHVSHTRGGNLNQNVVLQPRLIKPTSSLHAFGDMRPNTGNTNEESTEVEGDGFKLTVLTKVWRKINAVFQIKEPGALILIRHGETTLNYNRTFTGWIDTDLSDRGVQEMFYAARLLLERGYTIDATYTSRLKRAIRSAWIMYSELGCVYRPVYKSWRLNERMYGALEGTSKPGAVEKYGEDVVQSFRTGLKARPPPMLPDHPNYHANERKYTDLDPHLIPMTESLQDTMDRTLPLWQNRIKPDLLAGRTVMVVAHANSIRGILKHIDGLSEDQIRMVGIPNGIPLVYKFDKLMCPLPQENSVEPLRGEFLEKKGLLKEALAKEQELAQNVPNRAGLDTVNASPGASRGGYGDPQQIEVMDARLRGLQMLDNQRKRFNFGNRYNSDNKDSNEVPSGYEGYDATPDDAEVDADDVMDPLRPVSPFITNVNSALAGAYYRGGSSTDATKDTGGSSGNVGRLPGASGGSKTEAVDPESLADRGTLEASFRSTSTQSRFRRSKDLDNDSFIVMIRHGRTEYNKLGIFTGWEDAPLAKEGRSEARAAGKVLKLHGIEFDIVYTSWLSRAIETAWLVLDELNCLWLPIVKTWRLNERMYGALTGLSKKMIAQKHGDKQFKKWRRGYDQRPPQVSSFSSHYPGNDDRYQRYATDVRFSAFESIVRTLAHKRLELHRKFPKTESLQDCMRRTIPFFTGTIMPKSVKKGKTVLIASSENAIRGLLMHLCGIPEDRISEVEIPTGLPLVYSFRSKKIRLLEDGTEDPNNPLGNYNFGSAPELLFNACPEEGEVFTEDNDQCFFFPDGTSYAYDPLLRLEHAPTEEDIKAVKASSDNSALEGKTAQEDKERAEAATLETGGSGI